ncbi:WhiB family transcriptional regulator [Kitasatospora sp. NPDC127059]|uniref:WhiB family transcriptional regulator n=1 Tax=unclassified Kitasatospora TaxID=2633591 RepID=UPI00365DCC67
MTARRTLHLAGTRAPHRAARPAAAVLAEFAPAPDGGLPGAECAGADTELFFPDPDEIGTDAAEWAERRARMICAGCPVRLMCLAQALERNEPHGIFGGLNADERRRLGRRMNRLRARVNAGGAG